MKRRLIGMIAAALIIVVSAGTLCGTACAEPVTVTVYRGDPGDQPAQDNKIYKLIEEKLGVKFEFEFLEGDLDEELSLKLASGNYPDLFDGSNSAEMLEDSGALIDLLPYISEEETPNLYKHLHKDNEISQLKTEDGKLYIIPNYGINYNDTITNENNGPAFFIQKQVIAWNDYKVPTTLNEYFDLIEQYVAANPTDENGNAYTGFTTLCEDWRHYCLLNPVQHLMGRPNDGEVIVDVDSGDYHTETFIDKPYAKAYYEKLNEAYHKGLINQDTFEMSYDEYIANLSSGTVLGLFDQTWDIGMATSALRDAGKDENTFVAIPLVYDPEYVDGKKIEEHYLNGSTINQDRGFGISTTCENPEQMVKLFDTLLSDEWQKILNWGIEGEDYYIDENGRMRMTAEQYANLYNHNWQLENKADALFSALPKKQGTMDDGNAWDPNSQPENYYELMSEYDKAFYAKLGVKTPGELFNPAIELAPYGEAWMIDTGPIFEDHDKFLEIQDRMLPQIIQCDPDDLDRLWAQFEEEISPYADEVGEYYQEEIRKLVEKARIMPKDILQLPTGLTAIGAEAFFGIGNVGVVIPAGVEKIADDAFEGSVKFIGPVNEYVKQWAEEHGIAVIE